ncbi:MAG TPA: class I SAM-dependent methyltransferase [Bacteroidales bacterium]|nr:class I SAM-dependent methyltransferase [Bacteroidales bacterium]
MINLLKKIIRIKKVNEYCPVCNINTTFNQLPAFYFKKLQQYRFEYSIFNFETFNVYQYSCSRCGASDRERLIVLFLKQYFDPHKILQVLDIGITSKQIESFFKKNFASSTYLTLDKYNSDANYQLDVENMSEINDNSFDLIICSHVLEHIPNPFNAVNEIYRILKKQGQAIILVPILLSIDKTIENPSYNTDELRWKYYGQNDHLRLFSKKDFLSLIKSVPFEIKELGIDYFGADSFNICGLTETSTLYLCTKNEQ